MDDDPAGGGAPLAGRADGAEENPARREFEIGARSDNDGVVTAELEQAAPEAAGDGFADMPPHARRAGGRNQGDAGIVDNAFADGCAIPDHKTEDRGIDVVGATNAFGDFYDRDGGERGRAG